MEKLLLSTAWHQRYESDNKILTIQKHLKEVKESVLQTPTAMACWKFIGQKISCYKNRGMA